MSESIYVENLTKRFEKVEAVAGISFSVRQGELFGFLGPNGAGKTTTINMLTGLARPDTGKIRIGGIDCTNNPRAAQHLVGVVPDESNLYPELTGFDNLCFCASLYGMGKAERQTRAQELLDAFGLTGAAKRKFGGYSKGMKRKLTIADPNLLVLFEDWLEELEAEAQALIKTQGPLDEKSLADKLGLSRRGATFLLSKLERT